MSFLKKYKRYSLILFDALLVVFSYSILPLIFHGNTDCRPGRKLILLTICIHILLMFLFKCYENILKYSNAKEILKTALVGFCTLMLINPVAVIFKVHVIEGQYLFMAIMIMIWSSIFFRMAIKYYTHYITLNNKNASKGNLLIVGAGSAGRIVFEETQISKSLNYNVVGYIDDDDEKTGNRINGVKVLGTRNDIVEVCEKYNVTNIIIAIPSMESAEMQKLVTICSETNCKVQVLPGYDEFIDGRLSKEELAKNVRDVDIEDLLERDSIILDNKQLSEILTGKTVLVTGGGGSIGSELCRQIVKYNPGKLVIVDIYENNAYDIQNELRSNYPNLNLDVIIASVRDYDKLELIFDSYRPDMVYHAAAHKHVPLMEFSPDEAIKNNVFGTFNVAKCADKFGVNTFTLISTDKAVNPTNVMGATKRICEMIVQSFQTVSKTEFVAVRFGNVLGSNGSVIPLFKKQIENGGPVTVTHRDITRFFMTIPEASQLVLQASAFAEGGEIFVLDMGKPVKIYHLAEKLIKLSGYEPDKDIKIEVTGLRPGEKLYEELLMDEEGLKNTQNSKIFIGKPIFTDFEVLTAELEKLEEAINNPDKMEIKRIISQMVDTYRPDFECCNSKI